MNFQEVPFRIIGSVVLKTSDDKDPNIHQTGLDGLENSYKFQSTFKTLAKRLRVCIPCPKQLKVQCKKIKKVKMIIFKRKATAS